MGKFKTRLLFYEDPYLKEHKAKVVKTEKNVVWLNETIFFAESGGQESDRGSIENIPIIDIYPENFGHVLERDPSFKVGDLVNLRLDWDRRYRMMRLHSAAHVVYFVVKETLGDLEVIGSHVSPARARLDYAFYGRISDYFPQIMEVVNRVLSEPQEIIIYRRPDNPQIRIWKMDSWETPCSGLHVRNTVEIGKIGLKRRNLGKGKERIEIYLE